MEAFFVRVLTAVITSDAVEKMLSELMDDAAAAGTAMIQTELKNVADQVGNLEKQTLNNIDAMDGKVGNLQEQLTGIPGQIIQGILGPFEQMLKNPLGGLFGQK